MWMKRDFEYDVEDVFSLINGGVVVVGSVKKGAMQVGDKAWLLKGDGTKIETRIGQMETRRAGQMVPLKKVSEGEHAGVLLGGLKKEQVEIGDQLVAHKK